MRRAWPALTDRGGGAVAIPLTYAARPRVGLDERIARGSRRCCYAFAPAAMLYGVASADALYATLGLLAALPLLLAARRPGRRGSAAALALALA